MTIQTAIKIKVEAVLPVGDALETAASAATTLKDFRGMLENHGFERIEIGSKLTNINVRAAESGPADPGEA